MALDSSPNNYKVTPVLVEKELKDSFLDYAMSVIISRAIPDVRDGLKPVHRRVLYTMHKLGFHYNKPYHKSVRVVGEVLGKFHPHGDQAVYNTMVGMIQEFSKRYPLLDGQGNWGSVDGDNAAAMRYTEVRMAKISQEILYDIEKDTVQFVPNFDESTVEPTVLPSRLPNLLINGTAGIAVGMATSVPPHNLGEVVEALVALLHNPELSDDQLFALIPAPDFPTGGIICGRAGIVKAYKTGRGGLILRAVIEIEESKKGTSLVVTQLPYQVNKADLIIKIADLVKEKIIEGITNIKDESNKKGIRLVIDIKRGESPEVILNQLYKFTSLQSSVSMLMLALKDNKPQVFNLREILSEFLVHRRTIIIARTNFDLLKARAREHILEGFIKALIVIDDLIKAIKISHTPEDAALSLQSGFGLSEEQAKAILEMRLQRLTGLEREKIEAEIQDIKKSIIGLVDILENNEKLKSVIKDELIEIKNNYADKRKSQLGTAVDILSEADLIPEESVVVTLTKKGYIKRVPLSVYGVQHRGGKGKMGMASLDESDDIIQDVFVASTHDELLFFTNLGRVYGCTVYEVQEGSRTSKGRAIVNLLPLAQGESVVKLLCLNDLEDQSIVMVTKNGTVKRTDAAEFSKIRSTGIRALNLNEGDELVSCEMSGSNDSIVIATAEGYGIRFQAKEVRQMGRNAAGVIGIRARGQDYVVGMVVVKDDIQDILFVTQHGYGKRVDAADFRVAHRAGMGVRTIPTNERNGQVVGLALVSNDSSVLLIDESGKIIRLKPEEIRTMGRQAQGVRLIRLDEEQKVGAVFAFVEDASSEQNLEQLNEQPDAQADLKNQDDEVIEIQDEPIDEPIEN